MASADEIDEIKNKIALCDNGHEEAGLIVELLQKYASVNKADSKIYTDRLAYLAETLGSVKYKGLALLYLAIANRSVGEYATSLSLSQEAIPLFQQINDDDSLSKTYNNLGNVHCIQGNYREALNNHFCALNLRETAGDKKGIGISANNIGVIFEHQGNYTGALTNYLKALQISEELNDAHGIADALNNIGMVQCHLGNYKEVLESYSRALSIMKEIGDKQGIAITYNNIGGVYEKQDNFTESLKNHFLALEMRGAGDQLGIALSHINIGIVYGNLANYNEALENFLKALEIAKTINDKHLIATAYKNIGHTHEKQGNHPQAIANKLIALEISEEIGNKELIKTSARLLYNDFKAIGDFENALKYYEKCYAAESELLGEQAQKQLTNLNFMHNLEQKEKEAEISRLRNVELKGALDHLQIEKDNSEKLLLNILPAEVAEELKIKGSTDAKLFESVTVLYTDFVSFTKLSERLSPKQLVDELHTCFSVFDDIMASYNIEKIKTMGDAYMAVSGLPQPNANHAADVVQAAIEIRDFIVNRKKELGDITFDMRIGVHSGSVVAGIVGIKKYAYDIWGDTVNTAARMEQSGEAGKVNISQATYVLVKDKFKCEYRGQVEAKNKGLMRMYFVN